MTSFSFFGRAKLAEATSEFATVGCARPGDTFGEILRVVLKLQKLKMDKKKGNST